MASVCNFRIGCSGWSYSSWTGAFYPPNLENSDWLRFYSQIFDYVEIDSTFYRIPNEFMVKNWAKRTPDKFRFTAKFPKVITHDKLLVDVEDDIDLFLNNMQPLQEKTLALLIQPSSLSIEIFLSTPESIVMIFRCSSIDGRGKEYFSISEGLMFG